MPKIRLFVGGGTATEVYLRTLEGDGWATIVIGSRGLWAHLPASARMGQPPHLLQLPGQPVPAFQAPTGHTDAGLALFMAVQAYQDGLQQIAQPGGGQRINVPTASVTAISRHNERLRVTVKGVASLVNLMVDEVIIANGIGPQKTPEQAGIPVSGTPDATLGYVQVEEGIDFVKHPDQIGATVAVYGGGATAAWAAAEVSQRTDDWFWGARLGGEGFTRSVLPGDRNGMILALAGRQVRLNLVSARYIRAGQLSYPMAGTPRPLTPKVELTLSAGPGHHNFQYYVDQLVYCIGGDPAADGSIASMLDQDLAAELEPVRDIDNMVSRDGTGVLAWRNARRDLLVIGAATYNFSIAGAKAKQSAPMTWLPPNAKVPDGIALTVAVIEALNQYMPTTPRVGPGTPGYNWNLNFNTANRTQIAVFFCDQTNFEDDLVNLVVALILYFRSAEGHAFGITILQVLYIIHLASKAIEHVRQTAPNFEIPDNDTGLDNFILAITAPQFVPLWAAGGLRPPARAVQPGLPP